MARRSDFTKCLMVLCISIAAAGTAMADCATGVPDTTCPPGSINNILGNNAVQMQDAINREAAAQAQRDAQAQAQRDADLKKTMEESAAAADPRNQNDPGSPYYLGTPAQQCEAAKHSLACQLGLSCAPPSDLDCAPAEARAPGRRHTRHRHHP